MSEKHTQKKRPYRECHFTWEGGEKYRCKRCKEITREQRLIIRPVFLETLDGTIQDAGEVERSLAPHCPNCDIPLEHVQ